MCCEHFRSCMHALSLHDIIAASNSTLHVCAGTSSAGTKCGMSSPSTPISTIHAYQRLHVIPICTYRPHHGLFSSHDAPFSSHHGPFSSHHEPFSSHDAPLSSLRGMPFPNQYMKLYNASAHAVKAVHPSLRVGGPATMQLLDVVEFVQQASDPCYALSRFATVPDMNPMYWSIKKLLI